MLNAPGRADRRSVSPRQIPAERRVFVLAGAEGFEPSKTVLETVVIPFHYAPKLPKVIAEVILT